MPEKQEKVGLKLDKIEGVYEKLYHLLWLKIPTDDTMNPIEHKLKIYLPNTIII